MKDLRFVFTIEIKSGQYIRIEKTANQSDN